MSAMPDVAPSRRRGLRDLLGRFRRDERGVYAVEFGLIALPFFALIFATVEVAWVSFNAEQLQAAVDRVGRQIMTGQTQTSKIASAAALTSKQFCPTDGTRILPAFWDCSKLFIDVRTSKYFSTADMTNTFYTGSMMYCLGNPSTIVVLRVVYPLASIFPLSLANRYVGVVNNVPGMSGWYHILMGSAVFKTEPYQGSSPTC